jgi:hypothetical protein
MDDIERLKSYIMATIVPQGWGISFVDFEEHHLDKLILLAQNAKKQLKEEN